MEMAGTCKGKGIIMWTWYFGKTKWTLGIQRSQTGRSSFECDMWEEDRVWINRKLEANGNVNGWEWGKGDGVLGRGGGKKEGLGIQISDGSELRVEQSRFVWMSR
jgi:hypothetical protein